MNLQLVYRYILSLSKKYNDVGKKKHNETTKKKEKKFPQAGVKTKTFDV